MTTLTRRRLRAASAVALSTVLLGPWVTSPASAAATVPEVAPYMEIGGANPGNLTSAISSHGLRMFSAAFVIGSGCTPVWETSGAVASSPRSTQVSRAQAAGAVPIVSFGGQAGTELAQSCTSATKLLDGYTAVISKFHVTKVDFDIEGAAVTQGASVKRRFTAIKALEKAFPKLEVSLTVPVGRSGLLGPEIALLDTAKSMGLRVDVVNIMAMDFGAPVSDMGAAAIAAAKGSVAQLKKVWPKDGYRNLGITPEIGQNDDPGEPFTYQNALSLTAFAKANGVHRLAFWSLNRDQQCAAPGPTAHDNCSGLAQGLLDYTDAFVG